MSLKEIIKQSDGKNLSIFEVLKMDSREITKKLCKEGAKVAVNIEGLGCLYIQRISKDKDLTKNAKKEYLINKPHFLLNITNSLKYTFVPYGEFKRNYASDFLEKNNIPSTKEHMVYFENDENEIGGKKTSK